MHMNDVASLLFASYCVVDTTDDNSFGTYLESFVQISLIRLAGCQLSVMTNQHNHAKATVQWNTQRGVWMIANPALYQIFWKNCKLWYQCLSHLIFTFMMFSNTYLQRKDKCAQLLSTNFRWVHVYPMKIKGETHEALSLMLQHENMPQSMVMDGSKE